MLVSKHTQSFMQIAWSFIGHLCGFATAELPATIFGTFLGQREKGPDFMKIMAFGDIHEYLHPLASLAEPLQQADVVLVTGI